MFKLSARRDSSIITFHSTPTLLLSDTTHLSLGFKAKQIPKRIALYKHPSKTRDNQNISDESVKFSCWKKELFKICAFSEVVSSRLENSYRSYTGLLCLYLHPVNESTMTLKNNCFSSIVSCLILLIVNRGDV